MEKIDFMCGWEEKGKLKVFSALRQFGVVSEGQKVDMRVAMCRCHFETLSEAGVLAG